MTSPVPRVSERLDERMRREKLESAIAWFTGKEKPSVRRVSRGDLAAMLAELLALRSLLASSKEALEAGEKVMRDEMKQMIRVFSYASSPRSQWLEKHAAQLRALAKEIV